ncbi:Protein fantom Nephrocystin-8 RPGR-interacting protein 1-like protein [Channa argus]|uniref:Protein fantom Nephrocystin-8 RPGR-interacting protein 1-like protein n=2 Tax=Channa argus TaxID=215402 RepID=A0A6G1QTT4_CHAAH|nr:Protein fantom Nephrocystin-8 RPGR-interacting protein 1-like protein [Channa argus]
MTTLMDETAEDVPVKDITVNMSRLAAGPQDSFVNQNTRTRQDISRVSREELEDRFLRLHDDTLFLKEHIHKQDDKIKKLGTKLMRLVKDRGRMEQLAAGGNHPVSRVRDIEMEEMMEELQEKVRGLQTENEGLKQRLLIAKQQLMNSQCRRPAPYNHVQSRVNSGLKKLRDDTPSPLRPKSTRSLEGGARPPTGQLPRYGQSLLEEARAEIRNLENVIESQRSQMEEMEAASELLREEVRRKEAEYEENLLQVRQQQTSKLRSHVNSNVMMMKLQKQLADRSSVVTELEGRFQHLQESQQTLKASHDAALLRVEELSAQLKNEWMKSLDLEKQLQSSTISKIKMEQLQERISELEQERDLLKENNEKLVNSALDISQQQKWKIQEQQLRLQIAQLEAALKADLIDKNEILDKIKAERDTSEKLTEENKKLQIQFLEQKQQIEELSKRLKFYRRENDYNASELTEALLQIKSRKSQRNGDLGFLKEVDEEGNSNKESSIRELRAAHAETIQELEKTRNILSMESKISKDYKAELEAVLRKMESDKVEYDQKLKQQAQLLDTRAAKIKKLEAKLRDIAYGNTNVFKPDITDEDDAGEFDKTLNLEHGENLLELQIISAMLSSSALETLGDHEPSTFFTYSFYLFEMHSTPVVMGHKPKYGFTSKYVVSMDDRFLDYIHRCSLTVELHQALGLDWKTLATGRIRLQQLLEKDGKINGTIPLVGLSDEVQSFGSVDYWLRLRIPMTETIRLYKEKLKAVGYTSIAQSEEAQPHNRSWNELFITVQRCRDLQSSTSQQPSPYVVYKFFDFPDYPTVTVQDCCDPHFSDLKSYSVLMDVDLDQYLKSEEVQFYVFDYKEELIDTYLGKARVPLLSLAQGKGITGVYELIDPSGRLAGHIEVTLEWKSTYLPPSGLIVTVEKPKFIRKEMLTEETVEQEPECHSEKANKKDKLLTDKDLEEILEEGEEARDPFYCSPPFSSKAPLPELRQKTQVKEGPAAKKVTFVDLTAGDEQVVSEVTPAHQGAVEQEDDEEESHISEGQLVPAGSQSYSDDSDVSEEITKDEAPAAREDQSESTQSDSDDCIVHGQATGRKPSDRLRVEVVSLILRPESRVARDSSVVRLFVEYSFLDLPTEETPLSLPKPPQGKGINFNYSKVIPVDAENNGARRQLLREVLQGQNPQMERIRFTVVSEPPEEEEQERECEDVGVTFLRISDILEKQRDLMETSLSVVDVEDNSDVVGSLTVSVEGLEALRAIMEDQDLSKRTPVSSLLPST